MKLTENQKIVNFCSNNKSSVHRGLGDSNVKNLSKLKSYNAFALQ